MSRGRKRAELYAFAAKPDAEALRAYAERLEREIRDPLGAATERLDWFERKARAVLVRNGVAESATPEEARDACRGDVDRDLAFAADLLNRIRAARASLAPEQAEAFLLGYDVAMSWAVGEIEWRLGPQVYSGRKSGEGARRGGEETARARATRDYGRRAELRAAAEAVWTKNPALRNSKSETARRIQPGFPGLTADWIRRLI